jgi:hypothetical protein
VARVRTCPPCAALCGPELYQGYPVGVTHPSTVLGSVIATGSRVSPCNYTASAVWSEPAVALSPIRKVLLGGVYAHTSGVVSTG